MIQFVLLAILSLYRIDNLALGLWPRTLDFNGMAEVGQRADEGAGYGMVQVPVLWDFWQGRDGASYHERYDYMLAPIWDGQPYFSRYHIGKAIWLDFLTSDRRSLTTAGSFTDPNFAADFVEECSFLADLFRPDYFALGTEIDEYIRVQPPEEVDALYGALWTAKSSIRARLPNARVFVYFQYENVSQRGLWETIAPFVALSDVAGISSYPYLLGYTGATLPLDYYEPLQQYGKPVVFAEIGHPARAPYGTETDQADFINRWFRVKPTNTTLSTWFAVYDPNYNGQAPLFETMGLLRDDGQDALGWRAWLWHCPVQAAQAIAR